MTHRRARGDFNLRARLRARIRNLTLRPARPARRRHPTTSRVIAAPSRAVAVGTATIHAIAIAIARARACDACDACAVGVGVARRHVRASATGAGDDRVLNTLGCSDIRIRRS
jgi:hypothetical protein